MAKLDVIRVLSILLPAVCRSKWINLDQQWINLVGLLSTNLLAKLSVLVVILQVATRVMWPFIG
jgi:hypothetical protein